MERSEIIEHLYSTFSNVEKPTKIIGCWNGCCMSTAEGDILLRQNIRRSSRHYIRDLAADCLLTIGDEQAFKYYLPRMLEFSVNDPKFVGIPPSFLKRLTQAGFGNWDKIQQKSVVECLRKIFIGVCDQNDGETVEEWLCGMCHLPVDVIPFLEILDTPKYLEVKKDIFRYFISEKVKDRLLMDWWEEVSTDDQKPVFNWLMNEENILILIDLGYWVE